MTEREAIMKALRHIRAARTELEALRMINEMPVHPGEVGYHMKVLDRWERKLKNDHHALNLRGNG